LEKVVFRGISRRNSGTSASFRSKNLFRVLSRAKELNIPVKSLSHYPETDDRDDWMEHYQQYKRESKDGKKAFQLLTQWIEEGCEGWFYAYFDIPASALLAVEKG
jgi:hypothetical protein